MKRIFISILLFASLSVFGQTINGGASCNGGCSIQKTNASPPPKIVITNLNPPNGQTTIPYGAFGDGFPFTATGGLGTLSFSVFSGSIPTNLTLSSAGVLSGTPNTIQTVTFQIQVCDTEIPAQCVQSPNYTVQITNGVPPPVVTTLSFPNAVAGIFYSNSASATGVTPFTWTGPHTGSFPGGLSLSNSSNQGVLSGTPNVLGAFTFTLQVCDGEGSPQCTVSPSYTINVTAQQLKITNLNPPDGQTGTAYNGTGFQFTSSGGFGTISWSNIAGVLPNGLTLSSTGLLSGTPTASGQFIFTVQAQDAEIPAQMVSQQYTINITNSTAGPTITSGAPPGATTNTSYSFQFTANCPAGGCTWLAF